MQHTNNQIQTKTTVIMGSTDHNRTAHFISYWSAYSTIASIVIVAFVVCYVFAKKRGSNTATTSDGTTKGGEGVRHLSKFSSCSNSNDIYVTVTQDPLTEEERQLLQPDLQARGLSLGLLQNLPPKSKVMKIFRAYHHHSSKLLGITVALNVYPFVALKNMISEGNHVGWDISFYYTTHCTSSSSSSSSNHLITQTIVALMNQLSRQCLFYGSYFGTIDQYLMDAIPLLRCKLYQTDYVTGKVNTTRYNSIDMYLQDHKNLRRHTSKFYKNENTVNVCIGPIHSSKLVQEFAKCIHTTYQSHANSKKSKGHYESYAFDTCTNFLQTCPKDTVHIYATSSKSKDDGGGAVVIGCQTFIRHKKYLGLSEGGFLRQNIKDHKYAYEAIITESIRYAIDDDQLEYVSYGGIWNDTKDRYMDRDRNDDDDKDSRRKPIYALFVYDTAWKFWLFGSDWFCRASMLRSIKKQFSQHNRGNFQELVATGQYRKGDAADVSNT